MGAKTGKTQVFVINALNVPKITNGRAKSLKYGQLSTNARLKTGDLGTLVMVMDHQVMVSFVHLK